MRLAIHDEVSSLSVGVNDFEFILTRSAEGSSLFLAEFHGHASSVSPLSPKGNFSFDGNPVGAINQNQAPESSKSPCPARRKGMQDKGISMNWRRGELNPRPVIPREKLLRV